MSGNEDKGDTGKMGRKRRLAYDFTQDTTFHGVRFVTADTPYIVRRILWVLILLAFVTAFVYIVLIRLIYWLDRPKAVNVEIVYTSELVFPAVTICNQNFFRKSKTFESGNYDRVEERFKYGGRSGEVLQTAEIGCTEGFEYRRHLFFGRGFLNEVNISLDETSEETLKIKFGVIAKYVQTSIRVCQQLCLQQHDALCNSMVYNYTSKTCFVSTLAPSPGDPPDLVSSAEVDSLDRQRCNGMSITQCTFEDESCPLYQDPKRNFQWVRHSGHDHTLSYGHYLMTEPSEEIKKGSQYTLLSPFFDAKATPLCMRFYYHMEGKLPACLLTVTTISAIYKLKSLKFDSSAEIETAMFWTEKLIRLGTGVFQVEISATEVQGQCALDDITFAPCWSTVEQCGRTLSATGYGGSESVTKSGRRCAPWKEVITATKRSLTFLNGTPEDNHNFCRNPNNAEGPWCFVQNLLTLDYEEEHCPVPFCECKDDEFRCFNGPCINSLLKCDSIQDCPDGSDEGPVCSQDVSCTFEGSYICGYNNFTLRPIPEMAGWIWYKGEMRNGHVIGDRTKGTKDGYYMYLDSSQPTFVEGQRISMISGERSGLIYTNVHCLRLFTYTGRDAIFPEAMGSLRVYLYQGKYHKRILLEVKGTDSHSWVSHEVTFSTHSNSKIQIEAIFGSRYYSDMAVDDVQLRNGPCIQTVCPAPFGNGPDFFSCLNGPCIPGDQVCDGYDSCLPNFHDEDPDVCSDKSTIACNFTDQFQCGYQDDSDPQRERHGWLRDYNHARIKTQDVQKTERGVKRLLSPWKLLDEPLCLSFNYSLSGNPYTCGMYIHQEGDNNRTLLYVIGSEDNVREDTWRIAYTTLKQIKRTPTRISFEVNCSSDTMLSAGLSQITLHNGTCEDKLASGRFVCNFAGGKQCGYLDQSQELVNWVPTEEGLELRSSSGGFKKAVLLSPEIFINVSSMLVIELSLGGTIATLEIFDIYDNESVIWARRNVGSSSLLSSANVPLGGGRHRLRIVTELTDRSHVVIRRIYLETGFFGPAGPCGGFSCYLDVQFKVCLDMQRVCDRIADCYHGEDEGRCRHPVPPQFNVSARQPIHINVDVTEPKETENLTLLYYQTGHQIKDFLYQCIFAGRQCTEEDFITEITDYGLCHTINSGQNAKPLVKTAATGSSAGLQLLLNLEQYEYMPGPQVDAGVKVILRLNNLLVFSTPYPNWNPTPQHVYKISMETMLELWVPPLTLSGEIKIFTYDQKEVPQVRDLGFAVGPGQHALVGMTVSQYKRLEKPWGTCRYEDPSRQEPYTYSACVRDCEVDALDKACSCRDAFMPGDIAICSVREYLECASKQKDFLSSPFKNCTCPEPCLRSVYETQLSYAQLSRLSVGQILDSDLSTLNDSHLTALEVGHVTNPDDYIGNMASLRRLRNDLGLLIEFSYETVWSREKSVLRKINNVLWYFAENILKPDVRNTMGSKIDGYRRAYSSQYGILQKSFTTLSDDLQTDLFVLARSIRFFNETQQDSVETLRELLLKNKNTVVSLTSVVDEYIAILTDSLPTLETPSSGDLPEILTADDTKEPCLDTLNELKLKSESLLNRYIMVNLDAVNARVLDREAGDTTIELSQSADLFMEIQDLDERLLPRTRQCIGEYDAVLNKIESWRSDVLREIDEKRWYNSEGRNIDDILDFVLETRDLKAILVSVDEIVEGIAARRISLYEATQRFDDKEISDIRQTIDQLTSRIKNHLIDLMHTFIADLALFAEKVYRELFEFDHTISTYFGEKYDNTPIKEMTILKHPRPNLRGLGQVEIARDVIVLGDNKRLNLVETTTVVGKLIGGYRTPLERALTDLQWDFRDYEKNIDRFLDEIQRRYRTFRAQTVFDENFVKENFVAVDIFFSQLKYQDVEQLKAYDGSSFFAEVGGFMGLLLGGSVISLFEFFDLIVFQMCLWPCSKAKRANKEKKNPQFSETKFTKVDAA